MSLATTLWYGYVETSHFDFSALGLSADHARDAVMSAWKAHVAQAQGAADPDYVLRDDVQVLEMNVGQGYRDHDHPLGEPVEDAGALGRSYLARRRRSYRP